MTKLYFYKKNRETSEPVLYTIGLFSDILTCASLPVLALPVRVYGLIVIAEVCPMRVILMLCTHANYIHEISNSYTEGISGDHLGSWITGYIVGLLYLSLL